MYEFYVYVIFRRSGVPCYVGKGRRGRWEAHVKGAKNPHLKSIYDLAGGDLPVVKVQEGLSEPEAFKLEMALIASIGREKFGGPLVNLTDGGEGPYGWEHSAESKLKNRLAKLGGKLTDAHKEKIRAATVARNADPAYREAMRTKSTGRKHTEEAKEKVRLSKLGIPRSAEVRAKVSAARIGKKLSPEHIAAVRASQIGLKRSEEGKKNLSLGQIGRKHSPEHRAKNSARQIGKKMSEETRAKMREAHRLRRLKPLVIGG